LIFHPKAQNISHFHVLLKKRPLPSHDKLRNIKYDLIEDGVNIEYFHATNDKQSVRDMVSSVIKDNIYEKPVNFN